MSSAKQGNSTVLQEELGSCTGDASHQLRKEGHSTALVPGDYWELLSWGTWRQAQEQDPMVGLVGGGWKALPALSSD